MSTNSQTPLSTAAADPAPVSEVKRRAAMFGVTPDPDPTAKIVDISGSLELLTSAREGLLVDIAGMRELYQISSGRLS
jgi:hypothetical protein